MKCNNDCFNCIYDDCIQPDVTDEDIQEAESRDSGIKLERLPETKKEKKKRIRKYDPAKRREQYLRNKAKYPYDPVKKHEQYLKYKQRRIIDAQWQEDV